MRRGDEQILDKILFLGLRPDAPLAAARLVPVDVHRCALDVPGVAHGDQHVRVRDQVLQLDLVHFVHDLRAPLVPVGLLDLAQLADDHLLQFFLAGQSFFHFRDALADLLQFLEKVVNGKLRQAVQLQLEDGFDLEVGEPGRLREPVFLAVHGDARQLLLHALLVHHHLGVAEILE